MAVVAASAPQQSLLLLVAATALLITPMLVVCQEPALASVPDPGPLTRVGSTYKGPRTTSVLKDGIYQHVSCSASPVVHPFGSASPVVHPFSSPAVT